MTGRTAGTCSDTVCGWPICRRSHRSRRLPGRSCWPCPPSSRFVRRTGRRGSRSTRCRSDPSPAHALAPGRRRAEDLLGRPASRSSAWRRGYRRDRGRQRVHGDVAAKLRLGYRRYPRVAPRVARYPRIPPARRPGAVPATGPRSLHRGRRRRVLAGSDPGSRRTPEYAPLLDAVSSRRMFLVELLYSDHEGGQRAVGMFTISPLGESDWLCSMVRHWNLDRQDPGSGAAAGI